MQIRPQDPTRNMLRRLQEVMMVVPVDADVNEAQHIAEENRKEWLQGRKTGSLWRLHFQHHDGDDDGEYPVTKSLHAGLGHPSYSFFLRVKREQPVTGRSPPTLIALASMPVFARGRGNYEIRNQSSSMRLRFLTVRGAVLTWPIISSLSSRRHHS